MTISFDQSFQKSIGKLKNKQIANRIIQSIEQLEKASSLKDVSNVKKLKVSSGQGRPNYYRIRIGDYRLVLEELEANHVLLIIVAHRKDVYDNLP